MWSLRNNNNYIQTGLLVSLSYVANNRRQLIENFYEKSKRSILKARTEGPAAWILGADEPSLGRQADLLGILQKQHVEISRATAAFRVNVTQRGAARLSGGQLPDSNGPAVFQGGRRHPRLSGPGARRKR